MSDPTDPFQAGQRVLVVQQIPQRQRVWTSRTEGVVERFAQRPTGSWFAHARHDKLWLDRLLVRKDDGELVEFNLDQYTHVERLPVAPVAPPALAEHAGGDVGGDDAHT